MSSTHPPEMRAEHPAKTAVRARKARSAKEKAKTAVRPRGKPRRAETKQMSDPENRNRLLRMMKIIRIR